MTAHTVPTNEGAPKNKLIKRRFTRVYIERAVPAAAIKVEKKIRRRTSTLPRFEGSNQSLPPPCGQNDAVSLYCSSSLAARLTVESESLWALPGLLNSVQIRVALKEGFVEACTCMF